MKIRLVTLFLIVTSQQLNAQNYEKVEFDPAIEDGYYLAVQPKSSELLGVLVLLPGFGESAENIFPETKIHNVAFLHGLLTIAIAGGPKLYADEGVTKKLNDAFDHIADKYSIGKDKFVIGGFSAGGTISLRYAEYSNENPTGASIQPKGVFSVDAPVDLFDIWNYFQREIKKNYSEAGVGEAKFVSEIMLREIGDPIKNRDRYNALTPFNATLETPGNERFLEDIPVRVYHDVDIVWQLQNRKRSLFDSNALAASEMINRLLLMGNEKAEFMPAKQPGYRSSGLRHPHSWSIVDEVELIQWVVDCLKE
jgi:pimeloyl-ACP methyl ester carboxylesterase